MTSQDRPSRVPHRSGYPYLDATPPGAIIAMAHRGGALHPDNLGRENTLHAFRLAYGLGYRYLETDVHATKDGVLLAFHDETLDRVTDREGRIAGETYAGLVAARVAELHHIPTMAELLDALPDAAFNIDLKSDAAVPLLAELVARTESWNRVLVGAFSWSRIREFRRLTGGKVPTAAAPIEVAAFRLLPSGRLANLMTGGSVDALQLPTHKRWLRLVTPGFVRRAHAAGKQVHVWTIDDPDQMRELLDLGVDGLISDQIDVLKIVLNERQMWAEYP